MPLAAVLVFISVLATLSTLAHYYVHRRLAVDPGWSDTTRKGIGWALVVLGALPIVGMVITRSAPREVASPVVWAGMIWMGALFFLLLALVALDLGKLVVRLFRGESLDSDRRRFLARFVAAVAATSTVTLGARALYEGLARVRVERVRVPLAKLSASKSGYKIVQLTDVHVGPTIGRDFTEHIVAEANALTPDMIVITGDLVDGTVDALRAHVAPLADLRARDGVFFVTGNHEYYSGADEWIAHLGTLGIRVLRNEHVSIGDADGFDLVGVDDFRARGPGHGRDLAKAVRGRDTSRAAVLLAHQPKQIFEAARSGIDLQLSGHTHGGQLKPFDFLVRLEQPFLAGLDKYAETFIYVSKGTGYWGPPMRLGIPAEITEIELVRA